MRLQVWFFVPIYSEIWIRTHRAQVPLFSAIIVFGPSKQTSNLEVRVNFAAPLHNEAKTFIWHTLRTKERMISREANLKVKLFRAGLCPTILGK